MSFQVRGLDGRTICGRRARVEMSNGKGGGRGYRGPPPRSSRMARPFHPDDRCYECGDRGHYARDCSRLGRRTRRRYFLAVNVSYRRFGKSTPSLSLSLSLPNLNKINIKNPADMFYRFMLGIPTVSVLILAGRSVV